jgi:uncharacterized protein
MGKDDALAAISRFTADLRQRGIRPEHVVLFGSYATDTAHEWSDIDLVVVSPDFTGVGLWDRIRRVVPSLRAPRAPIEPVLLAPEEWADESSMVVQMVKQGRTIPQ